MISIIVAVSDDWGIGRNNDLLWHIPEDLKSFKQITSGKSVLMGKKTWESLPKRPLPGRKNIVLTDVEGEIIEGATMAYSINDAMDKTDNGEEIFIIGGGSIYRQFLPMADRLYITHVHQKASADIYFPAIASDAWKIIDKQDFPATETNPSYSRVIYERI